MFAPVCPWRRRLGLAALAVAMLLLLVVYVLPPVARRQVQARLGAQLGRPVRVGTITLNPFTARLRIRGLEVFEPDGETLALGFADAAVNLDPVMSALRRAVVVSEVTVRGPHAVVIRHADGSWNISDILDRRPAAPSAEAPAEPPREDTALPRLVISGIRVHAGWFIFRDEQQGARQRLMGLRIEVPRISTLPGDADLVVEPTIRADLNGREMVLDGSAKPFAATRRGTTLLRLQDFDLTALAPYLPAPRTADLTSGRLDIEVTADVEATAGGRPALSLTGTVGLRDLRLDDPSGEAFASLGALQVTLLPADLLQPAIHIGRVHVAAPSFRLQRQADGSLVLPRFGEPSPAAPPAAATPAPAAPPTATAAAATPSTPLTAMIDAVLVEAGRVSFSDASVTPAFATTVDFRIEAEGLTTAPEPPARVHLMATTEAEEALEGTWQITFRPIPAITGSTALRGLRLPRLMPYLTPFFDGVLAGGELSVSVVHEAALPADAAPRVLVSDLGVALTGLVVQPSDASAPPLRLAELTLGDGRIDLAGRSVTVATLAARGGEIPIERRKDGSISLMDLVRNGDEDGELPAGGKPAQTEHPEGDAPTATAPAQAWTVVVDDLSLSDWAVSLEDRQPGQPVRLSFDAIGLHVRNLSMAPGTTASLDLGVRINERGSLKITGDVVMKPFATTLQVTLQDLALSDFQHYLRDYIDLLVHGGALGTDLRLALQQPPGAALSGRIEGSATLQGLDLVDGVAGEDVVACREIALRGIGVDLTPLAVRLDEVAVTALTTAVTVHADGTLNLPARPSDQAADQAAPPEPAAAPAEATPAAGDASPLPLSIGAVTLKDCALVFTDQQVTPHYRLQLDELTGSVTGFAMTGVSPAQVDLAARLDGHAPVTVRGSLANPGPQMTLKLIMALKDFDLNPVTPYAGRYVGYAIQKGKLSFDLDYALDQRRLAAEHRVLVDQFAFGQRVDSPDALHLPVRLAVSLLKDRHGRIQLDVPVRGSLDDPQFSVLRVVGKVLRDLVTKAASAPFALLGSLVGGGGEELSTIDFAPGSSDLDNVAAEKLNRLGKALQERPELQLEVGGTVDLASDRDGLARQALQRQVRARRLAALAAAGKAPPEGAEINLDEKDRAVIVQDLYREAVAARTPATATEAAPAEERPPPTPATMEEALLERITVSEPEVRLLAGRRAARVREFLTTTGEVAPERVFVVEADQAAAGGPAARQARLAVR